MAKRWQERERTADRRVAALSFVVARSAGAKVKLDDFLPANEKPEMTSQESIALLDCLVTNKGAKRKNKKGES